MTLRRMEKKEVCLSRWCIKQIPGKVDGDYGKDKLCKYQKQRLEEV